MKIVLGVTGGIAAYKAAELVRTFVKNGDEVRCVMTAGAQEFITPLTLQVLSNNPVGTATFDPTYESEIGHIELARWADVIVVAPATANTIARLAAGFADDLLTTVITATTAPIVVAPAMNTQMYRHRLVQRNMHLLRDIGYHVVDPDEGELACKEVGPGRLPDAWLILEAVGAAVMPQILADKQVLVSAGPTREHLDPARFISNPSTGKMGFAIARAARKMGAEVTLVTGPSTLLSPYGVVRVDVEDAQSMHREITQRAADSDFIVMSAAVADWRPVTPSATKRAKTDMHSQIELERTPDILRELCETYADDARPFIIGFAAETHDVEERGRAKRERKRADMMVANRIGGDESTFGSETATAFIITPEGSTSLPNLGKDELAERIWKDAVRAQRHAGVH